MIYRNFGILIGYIIFFTAIYLLAAEYIPSSGSKGEILVFRRGTKNILRRNDIENPNSNDISHGVIDSSHEAENSAAIQRHSNVFHWRNVCYDVQIKDETRRILDQVDGWVKPGTLTALMVSLLHNFWTIPFSNSRLGCNRCRKNDAS